MSDIVHCNVTPILCCSGTCHSPMFFSLLYSSTVQDLSQLPEQWLQSLLDELTSAAPLQALCGTRRSAGVPFFIQVNCHKAIRLVQ